MCLKICFLTVHFRYFQNENVKLVPDIVGNASYKEHFEAVEQCFKVIGFTLEVILSLLVAGVK